MKIATPIIEFLAYFAKFSAIATLFMWLKTENYTLVVIAAILWAVGYALNKWELHLETKRQTPVKHYDYYVLRTIGWIMLVPALLSLGIPEEYSDKDAASKLGDLVCSIYLIASGGNRKSMYKKQEELKKEQPENNDTKGE